MCVCVPSWRCMRRGACPIRQTFRCASSGRVLGSASFNLFCSCTIPKRSCRDPFPRFISLCRSTGILPSADRNIAARTHYLSRFSSVEMKARQVENSKERNVVEASLPPRFISHKEKSTEVVKIDVLTGVFLAPVSHVSPHSR